MRAKKIFEKKKMNSGKEASKYAQMINEGIFDDPGNLKALASYGRALIGDLDSYMLEVNTPFHITIEGEDVAKFKFLFNKYRIKYNMIRKDDAPVTESINEEEMVVSFPIQTLEWDNVKFSIGYLPYVTLPMEEGLSRRVKDEAEFKIWKADFIKKYGDEGFLEGYTEGYRNKYWIWRVIDNHRYNEKRQLTIDAISSYYQKKGSVGFTGD